MIIIGINYQILKKKVELSCFNSKGRLERLTFAEHLRSLLPELIRCHLQGLTGSPAAGLLSADLPLKPHSVLLQTCSVINPAHTLVSSLH